MIVMRNVKLKLKNFKLSTLQVSGQKSLILNLQSAVRNRDGFTLIELALVMVVVGLLVGLGANMVSTLTRNYKYTQTRGIIDAAIETGIGYGAGNNAIPDPQTFKTEVTEFADAFKKDLLYLPDTNLYSSGTDICNRGTTNTRVLLCPDSVCGSPTNTIDNVAYVVASGAANFNLQTTSVGAGGIFTVKVYEQDLANIDDYSADGTTLDHYDDIVKWVTLNELKTKAGCLGAPLKILNNELPTGSVTTGLFSATIYANGGVVFTGGNDYKWCIDSGTTFPTGIANPASCTAPANCAVLANDEGTWTATTNLTISGTITAGTGTYLIPVFVRDNNDGSISAGNDNCAQKSLVLTINP